MDPMRTEFSSDSDQDEDTEPRSPDHLDFEEQEFQGDLWCASDEDEPTSPAQTAEEMPSSDDDIEDSSDNELHSNWSASSPVDQLRDDMILEAWYFCFDRPIGIAQAVFDNGDDSM
ncbi:BZ3500_MvSof-1268-A1-R1_Chr1-2g01320 [Microbotryum saponariae]|uniref:BZ3500_MvSof-1268-A1-R1_Chr1-2g01320 protein n=1 Tax=Microbotryum saponariae TaxID=289078 RepID=A0A2X0KXD1_9BASI|nr:BZ3500_MvSof-1268-A1-R1_Chr1-2g01320 [Microbotryum saponariae]SCZ97088.1 BZ3501_MvSof-1269-A2-R1_Chr1-2g00919 [Microbotryum saponariae]